MTEQFAPLAMTCGHEYRPLAGSIEVAQLSAVPIEARVWLYQSLRLVAVAAEHGGRGVVERCVHCGAFRIEVQWVA